MGRDYVTDKAIVYSLDQIGEILNLMCETATITGRTVQSMLDIQYGIRREIAYGAPQYTPLSLTFLCSESMQEKKTNQLDRYFQIQKMIMSQYMLILTDQPSKETQMVLKQGYMK